MRYSGANLSLESLTMAGDAAVGKNQQQGVSSGQSRSISKKGAAANRGREEVESEGGVGSEEQL